MKKSLLSKISLAVATVENKVDLVFDFMRASSKNRFYKIRNTQIVIEARGATNDWKEIVVVMSGEEYALPSPKKRNGNDFIILDLGAHIGCFSLHCSYFYESLSIKTKIFAFEPHLDNFKYLTRNLKRNNVSQKIIVKCAAISDYTGMGDFGYSGDTDANYLIENSDLVNDGGLSKQTSVLSLNKMFEDYGLSKIDILKIDIEGGEHSIFAHKESFDLIKSSIEHIFIEVHPIKGVEQVDRYCELLAPHFSIVSRDHRTLHFEKLQKV